MINGVFLHVVHGKYRTARYWDWKWVGMVKCNVSFRSDPSNREKWSTSKGGPIFSKLFRLDRTIHSVLDQNFRNFRWMDRALCYHIVQQATIGDLVKYNFANLALASKHVILTCWLGPQLRDQSHVIINYRRTVHNGNFSPIYEVWCRRTTLKKMEKSLNASDSEKKSCSLA